MTAFGVPERQINIMSIHVHVRIYTSYCTFSVYSCLHLSFHSVYNAEISKQIPNGHETIAVTADGRSGDLSGGGKYPIYLTVKKGSTHGYNSSTAITKLAVIADGKVQIK